MKLTAFYYTYSMEGMPFVGGWTTIYAPDRDIADAMFRYFHPDKNSGYLNCAGVYTEEQIVKTRMWEMGNFGAKNRETIWCNVSREVF